VDLLQEYVLGHPEWSVSYKRRVVSAVRSFFMHNRAPMPPDPGFAYRSEREAVVPRLTVDEFRRIALASNPMYRAIWLCMLQSGMGARELLYWSRSGWESLRRQLREDRHPIRIDLPGRKRERNVKPYYTFIGHDAAEALRAYLDMRPSSGRRAIFINKFGRPLRYPGMMFYWLRKLRELGLTDRKSGVGAGTRYGRNMHQLRSLFKSRWRLSGCDPEVCEFYLGHDIDRLGYDKSPWLFPEWFEEQYLRAEPWLNVLSEDPGKVPALEVVKIKRQLEETQREVERLRRLYNFLADTPEVLDVIRMLTSRREP
jgi:integrase